MFTRSGEPIGGWPQGDQSGSHWRGPGVRWRHGLGWKGSNSEDIFKMLLLGLADGLSRRDGWGRFLPCTPWWRCYYSDEETERGCRLGGGKSVGQFGHVPSSWRRHAGCWRAQERSLNSNLLRIPLWSGFHPFLPHKCSRKDPITHYDLLVARSNGWFSISFFSASLQHLTQLATLSLKHIILLLWHHSGLFSLCGYFVSFSPMQFKLMVSKF